MQTILIILLCILSAIAYGIVHDQITVRICLEYFTIGHPTIFETTSPTLLAFGWGVIATWWVGLPLGLLLALTARAGSRPRRSVASLIRPIAQLLVIMGCCAALAGVVGYGLAKKGIITLPEPLASAISMDRHSLFLADWFAHSASYATGLVGGLVVALITWKSRAQNNSSSEPPKVALTKRI